MSDYQWTEKQIKKVYETRKHKKRFLNAREIRAGVPAADVRKLMKIIVDRGYAFDNELDPNNEKYEICFNLAEKDRIIENLDRFDNSLFISMQILNSSVDSTSKHLITEDVQNVFMIFQYRYLHIYEVLSMYQNSEDIENFEVNLFDREGNIHKFLSKFYKQVLLLEARNYIDMYKAIKIGWRELKEMIIAPTYNDFFLEIVLGLRVESLQKIVEAPDKLEIKWRSQLKHLRIIENTPKFVEDALLTLILSSNSIQNQEFYRSKLKEFHQNYQGNSLKNAVFAMRDAVEHDATNIHIWEMFEDLVKSYLAVDRMSFIDATDYDFTVAITKDVLALSSDSRVLKALSNWKNSGNEVYPVSSRLFRFYADNPEQRF